VDFCGIPEDDDRLDVVLFVFVPSKDRLCSRTAVAALRLYSLTWTGLSELELFLDFEALLFEDRDEEERPFCADNSSGRRRYTISEAMATGFNIVRSSLGGTHDSYRRAFSLSLGFSQ